MDVQDAIRCVTEHRNLSGEQMRGVMRVIMTGKATPSQIGGFLVGLRMKGETVDEIAAATAVMRELATGVRVEGDYVVDTCGTGGDGTGTFNVSTTTCFVVAAAGGKVAKHGNRSISGKTGSADVLEAAGVNIDISPEQVASCVDKVGLGFMFAPKHHGAMHHAIGPRREMGVRTLFNVLGPLTNPAGAPNQLIGVYDERWVEPLAQVLGRLGSDHVLVVHADDGLDEISIGAPTQVAELKGGRVTTYTITPEQFGFERTGLDPLTVDGPQESVAIMRQVLEGLHGPARDIVCLNAGAAIYAANLVDNLSAGIRRAGELIASGAALAKLDALVALTNQFAKT